MIFSSALFLNFLVFEHRKTNVFYKESFSKSTKNIEIKNFNNKIFLIVLKLKKDALR